MVKKTDKATKRLIPLFQSHYEDVYGEEQLLNWPLIKSAEKVAGYYTIEQVEVALAYYFSHYGKHALWDFIYEIDKIYTKGIEDEQLRLDLDSLIKQTQEKMKEFE